MFNTPILFLIFNRPELTRITFESICRIKPQRLFIAADGPRLGNHSDEMNCMIVREYVLSKIDWDCDVKTLFRNENLGCGKAVSSAITWFFSQVDEGIILEDDCLPEISFYSFCSDLLAKYRYDSDVMSISGSNLLGNSFNFKGDSYLWGLGGIWGWATWKRAWDYYDFEMKSFSELNKTKFKSYFKNYQCVEFYYSFFEEFKSGNVDTWDIQWLYTIVINNSLSINPSKNLVVNLGFGPNATHTIDSNNAIKNLQSFEIQFPLIHPNKKVLNQNYLKKTISLKSRKKSIFHLMKKKFKSVLKKL